MIRCWIAGGPATPRVVSAGVSSAVTFVAANAASLARTRWRRASNRSVELCRATGGLQPKDVQLAAAALLHVVAAKRIGCAIRLNVTGCLPDWSTLSCRGRPPAYPIPRNLPGHDLASPQATDLAYEPHVVHHMSSPLKTSACPR